MNIFVTVGLEVFPFDRLVGTIDDAVASGDLAEDVFIQYGRAKHPPVSAKGAAYLDHEEMIDSIARADVVVAHAGVGTFLHCHEAGKVPVLFPRRHGLGEHVDDHQATFSDEIEKLGMAVVVRDAAELLPAIQGFTETSARLDIHAGESHTTPQLIAHVRELIMRHGGSGK